MNDMIQPFTKLATANAELITGFAQSPATFETANANLEKYFALVQQSFGRVATFESYADLIRKFTDNYLTFAKEYSANLLSMATQGQNVLTQQVEAASERFAQTGKATVTAIEKASDTVKHLRIR